MASITRGKVLRGDLALYDGKTKTATRPDATGGTTSGLTVDNTVDILQVFGAGVTQTNAAIAAAVAHIGSSAATLVFAPGTWTIAADVTIPANATCQIPHGCLFSVDSGKTLTINGHIQAGIYQIFSGSGTISGLSKNVVTPIWWQENTTPGTTDMTAAIQAAVNSCGLYGSVFIPKGDYLVTGSISIVNPLRMYGEGFGSLIYVASSVGATTDIFVLTPTTYGSYFMFQDFAVAPKSGTPGRHIFYLDSTNKVFKDCVFDGLTLYYLNSIGYSIYGYGSGGGEGSLAISDVTRCTLGNGLYFVTCGDGVRVTHNHIYGPLTSLNAAWQSGASSFLFADNVVTADGGMHISTNATTLKIIGNEFETTATFTGSNGALIDIDGAGGGVCNDTIIADNSFQVVNSITTNTIRVNYGTRTHIFANRMGRGITTSNDVSITANAIDTIIGSNTWPSTTPVISDSGTRTVRFGPINGVWYSPQYINLAGVSGADNERLRLGRTLDGDRYSSLYSQSASGGTAHVSVRVHDGVSATSQTPAVLFKADATIGWTEAPNVALTAPAVAKASGQVGLGNGTQTTVGAAGAATALPGQPTGYLKFFIGSTQYVLPYYLQA